jgi:hypothetical protein
MKLLTKEIEQAFIRQGDTSRKKTEDIQVICKWFNPVGAGTWYVYERDSEDPDIFWVFADLGDSMLAECGTVSLKELQTLNLPLGMSIERDIHFSPCSLASVINKVKGW